MYYEIEGATVWLLGSVHLLPATAPTLPDWVWRAYEWAETIVFEHDWVDAQQHISLKAGDSLKRHPLHLCGMEWSPRGRQIGRFPRSLEGQISASPWAAP